MAKINGCPYQSKNGNVCTNKYNYAGTIKKQFCPFSNPLKCKLYNQWLKQRKSQEDSLKLEFHTISKENAKDVSKYTDQ